VLTGIFILKEVFIELDGKTVYNYHNPVFECISFTAMRSISPAVLRVPLCPASAAQ